MGNNSSPGTIAELNSLPIRNANGAVVEMKDVAWVHDGYQPQTSYVSENGQASALLTVIKNGASSTITIVDQVKAAIPRIKAGLPSALTLTQSSINRSWCAPPSKMSCRRPGRRRFSPRS